MGVVFDIQTFCSDKISLKLNTTPQEVRYIDTEIQDTIQDGVVAKVSDSQLKSTGFNPQCPQQTYVVPLELEAHSPYLLLHGPRSCFELLLLNIKIKVGLLLRDKKRTLWTSRLIASPHCFW